MASTAIFRGGLQCSSVASSADAFFDRIPGSAPDKRPAGGRPVGKLEKPWPNIVGPSVIPAIFAAVTPTSSNGGPSGKAYPDR